MLRKLVLYLATVKHFTHYSCLKGETVFNVAYLVEDILHFLGRCKELAPVASLLVAETDYIAVFALRCVDAVS